MVSVSFGSVRIAVRLRLPGDGCSVRPVALARQSRSRRSRAAATLGGRRNQGRQFNCADLLNRSARPLSWPADRQRHEIVAGLGRVAITAFVSRSQARIPAVCWRTFALLTLESAGSALAASIRALNRIGLPAMPQLPPPQLTGLILQARPLSASSCGIGALDCRKVDRLSLSGSDTSAFAAAAKASISACAGSTGSGGARRRDNRGPLGHRSRHGDWNPVRQARVRSAAAGASWSGTLVNAAMSVRGGAGFGVGAAAIASGSSSSSPPPNRAASSPPPERLELVPPPEETIAPPRALYSAKGHLVARQRLTVGRQMQCLAIWEQPAQFLSAHPRPGSHAGHVQMHERRSRFGIIADAAALQFHRCFAQL
jgi:hypothetical protein